MDESIRSLADIDAAFLSEVLDAEIEDVVGTSRIGTGQMSQNHRLVLEGNGPHSVVVKVPAAEPATRQLGATAYRREVYFYADIATTIDAGIAHCYHHAISDDGTDFLLVLDDLAPATQGDQLAGCSRAEAERALSNLAGIHAAAWNDDRVLAGRTFERGEHSLSMIYPLACDEFLRRYRNRLRPGTAAMVEAFVPAADAWADNVSGVSSIVHGDYRLDNLLFQDDVVVAVDWQTVAAGPPARDVAYFLGNSLTIDDRRRHEAALLEHYRAALATRGIDYGIDALRRDCSLGAWLGVAVTVVGSFVASRTDRGDEMFIAMADRVAAQLGDHASLDLL